jgi:3',5'-cyclic AMP phosphodiesterase CpdA
MRGHARELAAGLALAALAALAACSPGTPTTATPTTAAPTTAAPTTAVPTALPPTASASATPPAATTVLGVLGDFGVDAAPVRQVVALMRGFGPLAAVVTTGDDAYPSGTPAQAAFARRVLAPLLGPGTRLYAALGNHDEVTGGGRPVMAALGIPARWYTARVGPVELVVLDANRPDDKAQLAFLRGVLARPRAAAFRVVVFHQPAAACSFHKPDPGVVRSWVPLFAGRVDLVLSGHNHTYERFAGAGGLPYVTTGGGGAALYPSSAPMCAGPARPVFFRTVHHAVRLTVTATTLRLDAVGLDGRTFDSVTVRRAAVR